MRSLVRQAGLEHAIELDSAGTGGWHAGEPPDRRAQATAARRGIELTSRARKLMPRDLERFDYLVAMDRDNHADMLRMATSEAARARIHLLRRFEPAPDIGSSREPEQLDVPDPYYGGDSGFDQVFDICERACHGLLAHVREAHGLESP